MNCRLHNTISYLFLTLLMIGILQCTPRVNIKTGREAYYAKQYAKAATLLKQEYRGTKKRSDKAILAYFVGASYTRIKQPAAAAEWYQKAYKKGYGDAALVKYAEALIRLEQYDEALAVLLNLQKQAQGHYAFERLILQAKRAQFIKNEFVDSLFEITPLTVNTNYNEYGTTRLKDGTFIFTSDRPEGKNSKKYPWIGNYYMKMYQFTQTDDTPLPWLPQVQSQWNDGTPTLNEREDRIVFTSCYFETEAENATCKLMESKKEGDVWSPPQILPFIDPRYNYTTPWWDDKTQTLYYSSDIPGGKGGYDLYSVALQASQWSKPMPLGQRINTPKDEVYPTLFKDTLFYSSDGLGGMGGLDLFKVFRKSNGKWSSPRNIGYPFNSGGDDICAIKDTLASSTDGIKSAFYISSTRQGGQGGFDLYLIKEKQSLAPVKDTLSSSPKRVKLHLAITTVRPSDRAPSGYTPLPKVGIKIHGEIELSDRRGLFIAKVAPDTVFKLLFSKKGYFTQVKVFDSTDSSIYQGQSEYTYQMRVEMRPIIRDKEIVLKDIHYDFDKWEIRADARPTLDTLYDLLRLNPRLNIELAAHTDCRGKEDYNLILSKKRAESVVQYLINRGISPTRLSAIGYGETRPLVQCRCADCTDTQRQKNRRTTFKVIGKMK